MAWMRTGGDSAAAMADSALSCARRPAPSIRRKPGLGAVWLMGCSPPCGSTRVFVEDDDADFLGVGEVAAGSAQQFDAAPVGGKDSSSGSWPAFHGGDEVRVRRARLRNLGQRRDAGVVGDGVSADGAGAKARKKIEKTARKYRKSGAFGQMTGAVSPGFGSGLCSGGVECPTSHRRTFAPAVSQLPVATGISTKRFFELEKSSSSMPVRATSGTS